MMPWTVKSKLEFEYMSLTPEDMLPTTRHSFSPRRPRDLLLLTTEVMNKHCKLSFKKACGDVLKKTSFFRKQILFSVMLRHKSSTILIMVYKINLRKDFKQKWLLMNECLVLIR